MDLILRNGRVVLPDATLNGDVAIKGSKIAAIGEPGAFPNGATVIDLQGKFVLPGVIDTHVHFGTRFMGTVANDGYGDGTVSASLGGVTTIFNFVVQKKGESALATLQRAREDASANAAVDYCFHACLTDFSPETFSEIERIIEYGVTSFKVFMTYRKEGRKVDASSLLGLLERTAEHNAIVGVHAETACIGEAMTQRFLDEGKTTARYHALSKPNIVEAEAINRALFFAGATGGRLYIAHMSTREGVEMVRDARHKGYPVYAETCPHYLTLTKERLDRADGINFIMSPPLRQAVDVESLWQALADGTISFVGSDHVNFDTKQKQMGVDSFALVPNGVAGVEVMLPILFSEGVAKGRITANRLSEVVSTNAAKIFGLYPQKGILLPGSDADLVVVDGDREVTIRNSDLHMHNDYSVYEGMSVKGWPVMTICKGKITVKDGQFLGEAGRGAFLRRPVAPGRGAARVDRHGGP